MSTYDEIKGIVVYNLLVDPVLVTDNARLVADLGADELGMASIIIDLEAHYQITIPDDEAEKFITFIDIFNYILKVKFNGGQLNTVDIVFPHYNDTNPYVLYPDPKNFITPYPWPWPNVYRYGDPNAYNNPNYNPPQNTVTNKQKKIAQGLVWALDKVQKKVPYAQQHGDLRTANTPEALAYMDCSEMVCRFLKEIGLTSTVQSIPTSTLQTYLLNTNLFEKNTIPKPGDIYIWYTGGHGHTGIVRSYNPATTAVTYLHETSWGDVYFAQQGTANLGSRTFTGHSGWIGFFSPKIN